MSDPTRRDLLQAAAAAGAAPSRKSGLTAKSTPKALSDNLFVLEDTCQVYLIRDGRRGLLIDFGSGAMLPHLGALGVEQIDAILHTHHHRDQCQGDHKAVSRGIPIAVPAHERHLFADAENFWRNRRVFHLYYMRNDFQTLTKNVPVARSLQDYSTFRWGTRDVYILPTPGHTLGSISLLMEVDGRRVAFSGDLMYAPGKIQTLFDTQVNYGGSEGIDLSIYSLGRLREQKPALLCPSHGEVIPDPDAAMAETMRRLTDYYRYKVGEPTLYHRPFAVSPHLIAFDRTMSSFYAIVSDSGKAMFIDYGSASDTYFWNMQVATATTDRIRFVEHSIDTLQRDFGVKSIPVAMPSHMHDDHINGFPHLIRRYGTEVWCYENMVDIFHNPRGKNLGCILAEPFPVKRAFQHGERFQWEEFSFEITHSPGHTEYQMALFVTLDGQRVAFTGDAYFEDNSKEGVLRHNTVFRNQVNSESHLKSVRNLIEHEPTLIAPGHGKPFRVDRPILLATEQKLRRQQKHFFDLLPEGEVDFGLDPSWVSLYPYQLLLTPGATQQIEVRVRNYKPDEMHLEVALITPAEWIVDPDVIRLQVPGRGQGKATARIRVPRGWVSPSPRLAIAADVMRDGKYLGQITEAVAEIRPPQKT